MDTISVSCGFTDSERTQVAELYWTAFERKLRPGFSSTITGFTVVRSGLRPEQMLVARKAGTVIGICGFHAGLTGAIDMSWPYIRRTLSPMGALRVLLALAPLSRHTGESVLTLDGISVQEEERGLGVGSLLLDSAAEYARSISAQTIRLSVIDSNPRAEALYLRRGFVTVRSGSLGPLAPVYGFDGYKTMECEVPR